MDEDLRQTIEAILFSCGRKMELAELAKLCKKPEMDVLSSLESWKKQLDDLLGPIMLVCEGNNWKLTVREKYNALVKKVVTKTELPKSILQTLAVVAYKSPVLQSKVIKVRTNKAYEHLNSLEENGFINREKKGRTKLIKLAPKFFEYFAIDPAKLRDKFSSAGDIELAIEQKEKEIETSQFDLQKETEQRLETPRINLHLETYPVVEPIEKIEVVPLEIVEEKLGTLPVYDVPKEAMTPEEQRALAAHEHLHHHKKNKHSAEHSSVKHHVSAHAPEQTTQLAEQKKETEPAQNPAPTLAQKLAQETAAHTKSLKDKNFSGKGIEVTDEMEKKIDERVDRIIHGESDDSEKTDK